MYSRKVRFETRWKNSGIYFIKIHLLVNPSLNDEKVPVCFQNVSLAQQYLGTSIWLDYQSFIDVPH